MESSNLNLPRPTQEIYEERLQLEKYMNSEEYNERADRWLDIMNHYNWSTEVFEENKKYGLKKWDGSILLPAAFDNFLSSTWAEFESGDFVVAQLNGKYGIVNIHPDEWTWHLEPEFEYISQLTSIFAVRLGEKWGIMERDTKKYIVEPVCDNVCMMNGYVFINGICVFKKDIKYGVINDDGICTEIIFDDVETEPDEYVKVKIGEKWGYISEQGNFVEEEDEAYFFNGLD